MKHKYFKIKLSFERLLGISIINGRIYFDKFFKEESVRILNKNNLLADYKKLIENYKPGDLIKAEENQSLFLKKIFSLNLHKSKPLRILDIGGRAGLFSYYCKYYGHEAITSDIPEVLAKSPNREILKLLNIETLPLKIMPLQNLPTPDQKFELITGFRTRFHSTYPFETGNDFETHWNENEWRFFLKNLSRDYLTQDGQIFFLLNRLQPKERGEKFPIEMRNFFKKMGGTMEYNSLFLKKNKMHNNK